MTDASQFERPLVSGAGTLPVSGDAVMQARLRLLERAITCSADELLTATLDEMEALTGSSIGSCHFVEPDQKTVALTSWSTNTRNTGGEIPPKGTRFGIEQVGVWDECVRLGGPVLGNNGTNLPRRKSVLGGHLAVSREAVVPIMRGGKVVAIVAVGNKQAEYERSDLDVLCRLGDLSWDIVERKLAEEALRRSEEEKTVINELDRIFLTAPSEKHHQRVAALAMEVTGSRCAMFGHVARSGSLVLLFAGRTAADGPVPGKWYVFRRKPWNMGVLRGLLEGTTPVRSEGPFEVPGWHVGLQRNLGVPIVPDRRSIGLLLVANKEAPYTDADQRTLERIADNLAAVLESHLRAEAEEHQRKAAERHLRESEEKYRLLVTNADEAIFIAQDGAIKFPNPRTEEMSGYSREDLAAMDLVDLICADDREKVRGRLSALAVDERPDRAISSCIVTKSGSQLSIRLTVVPIVWESEPGVLCFLRDVTDETRLETQLMKAHRMEAVGRLAGGVAHDFNNMLQVILGRTEFALMNAGEADSVRVDLMEIGKAARRSADLTKQLLAFAHKQTVSPRVLDVNETLSGMLGMLRHLLGEDIRLVWSPGTAVWPITMDPSQLDQVLANLCVNARDAISGVGQVTIETGNIVVDSVVAPGRAEFPQGDYVVLTISDDGCGMGDETLEHVFEPFFTTKSRAEATGLGLATVHGIVEQNHGVVEVESRVGVGTSFRIYFPRFVGGEEEKPAAETGWAGKGRGTILLVEDEEGILALSSKMLEQLGYTVLEAATPAEAIRTAEARGSELRLVLTDVVMPQMNGPDLVQRLRALCPDIKWLYMSGYSADSLSGRGIAEEGVRCVQKPFSMKELETRVREALEGPPAC